MGLEETVEECTSLILAGSPAALLSAAEAIEKLRKDLPLGRFSRVLQEILAYRRGAVVDHLLQQLFRTSPADCCDDEYQRLYACKVLVALSENEAVAKYCTNEKQKARSLVKAFLNAQAYLMKGLQGQLRGRKCIPDHRLDRRRHGNQKHVFLDLALENVRGFASFSFASKNFRLALRTVECESFFPSLESFLARDIAKNANPQLVEKAVKHFSNLMHSFCLHKESQDWAFDHGMVRIHAALARFRTTNGATERFIEEWTSAAVGEIPTGAGAVLFRRLFANSEQGLLELDRRIRDARDARAARELRERWLELGKADLPPGTLPLIGLGLGGKSSLPAYAQGLFEGAVDLAKNVLDFGGVRQSEAPLVCCWEGCNEGSVEDAGRKFSKCAKCSLAFYCCKEHQRLHWTSHKKQCSDKSPPANTA